MMLRHLRKNTGFTLIELMIAAAVVALIVAIALPSYRDQVRKSRRADATSMLLEVGIAQEKYRANNPSYTSDLTDLGYGSAANLDSRDGFYTINVTAANGTSFTATAVPKAGTDQTGDSCAMFTITQNGPDTNTDAKKDCWGKG